MAVENICGKLLNDIDISCVAPVRKYYQQVVIINKTDIDTGSSVLNLPTLEQCAYNVEMVLQTGKAGIRIQGIEAGTNFKGYVSKGRDDNGYPTYIHSVDIFMAGVSEETKCALEALDRGSYVVAMQLSDGTVEVFGWENGLSTGDYDYDPQENGGGSVITLQSSDQTPENRHPLVYSTAGNANTDFNDKFEAP